MPFSSAALTSGQYDSLRGTSSINPSYSAQQVIAFCPNTIVYKARVSSYPTTASIAQLTMGSAITGSLANIRNGMTVLISIEDNDIRAAQYVLRIRQNGAGNVYSGTTIYVNETSIPIRTNAYVWVINDYRVWDRLARQVGAAQYKDYDIAYTTPSPVIYNLQSAYGNIVSGSPLGYTVSFAPLGYPITSGASINNSTWVWTIPSGGTITAGSSTTQNITVRFDSGFADWITVQVSDSNGKIGYFHFFVVAIAADFSNVITPGGEGAQISGSLANGFSGSITAFNGVSNILDNTLCVIIDLYEAYNGTVTSILSNVKFVGRLRKESDETRSDAEYTQIQQTAYELEGALAQFSRIEHLPFTLRSVASPTVWDEIANMTVWRAIAYTLQWHSTFLTLFALTFDSTDTTYLYPLLPTQGGNILSVVNDLAASINAALENAPTGECRVVRNVNYLSALARLSLLTVANFGTADLIDFTLDIQHVDETGKVQASGGWYNSTSGQTTPLLSLAPGVAQDVGEGTSNFTRQVLAANQTQANAQAELNDRTGNEYAIKQRPQPTLQVVMPDGYHFLVPSANQRYTWTLPATTNTGGRAYTTADFWQLQSIEFTQDNEKGSKDVTATFQMESQGTPGQTVTYVNPATTTPSIPVIPPLPPFPTFPPPPIIVIPPTPTPGDTPPYTTPLPLSDGNTLWLGSAAQTWFTQNALLAAMPLYTEITPTDLATDETLQQGVFKFAEKGGAYLLSINSNAQTYTDDMTSGLGAKTHEVSVTYPFGFWGAVLNNNTGPAGTWQSSGGRTGGGCIVGDNTGYTTGGKTKEEATAVVDLGAEYTITDASMWFVASTDGFAFAAFIQVYDGSGTYVDRIAVNPADSSTSWHQLTFSGSYAGIRYITFTSNMNVVEGTCYTDDISVTYTAGNGNIFRYAPNIFAPAAWVTEADTTIAGKVVKAVSPNGGAFVYAPADGSDATVNYSIDNGANWSGAVAVGASPGADGGFDAFRVGSTSLAAMVDHIKKATTSGGAYSNYTSVGQPAVLIVVPYYKFGTTTKNSGSTPDYLLGTNALDGGEALWKVTASGATKTAITPSISGTKGLCFSPNCVAVWDGNPSRIAAILLFSGVAHLMTSTNAGTSWTDRGALSVSSVGYIRFRRGDLTGNQLFWIDGATIRISQDFGVTKTTKLTPTTDNLQWLEVY
jgi:hypothetical protein